MINHPYNRGPDTAHGQFDDTPLRLPPFSAPAIPFRWVLRENMSALGEEHALDVQEEREPDLGDFGQTWVQNRENQGFTLLSALARQSIHAEIRYTREPRGHAG
jgi:hypothetical protein